MSDRPSRASSIALLASIVAIVVSIFALRGGPNDTPAGPADENTAAMELEGLRAELDATRNELAGLRTRLDAISTSATAESSAGSPSDGRTDSIDSVVARLLESPSEELEDLLADAVERAQARGKEGTPNAVAEGIIAFLDAELDRWSKRYDLYPDQVDDLKALARRAVAERQEAEAEGASEWEITELDVQAQAQVRQIVGDDVYRQTERERLTREARGALRMVSFAVGGLSSEQNEALDAIVERRVAGKLDDVVRIRSVALGPDQHAELESQLEAFDADAWQEVRENVLTEAQRKRLPEE